MILFFRRLSPNKQILFSVIGAIILMAVITLIFQFSPSADETPLTATLTITDKDGTRQESIGNLHTMRLTPGSYTITSTIPSGNSVWYSACTNCTEHSANTYTLGSRAVFTVNPNEFIDVVWYYTPRNNYNTYRQIIDCSVAENCQETDTQSYAYGPAIVQKEGTYHAFYCSRPDQAGLQDYLRYTSSKDGKTWSKPKVVVKASLALGENGLKSDLSACDPSLVFYKGYYYLYYSGAYETGGGNNQTVIQVARSENIDGPYLKYTKRGTWEADPDDPKHIIRPLTVRATPDIREQHFYGAGQPSVIEKDGKLLMWYLDDSFSTVEINGETFGEQQVYILESTNPVEWETSSTKRTNLGNQHGKFKYDPVRKQFVTFRDSGSHSRDSQFDILFSNDGITWGTPITIISKENFPDFSNNLGISSDERGWTIPGQDILVGFAAPYDLSPDDTWGVWDLYGFFYNYNDALLLPEDGKVTEMKQETTNMATIGYVDGVDGTGTAIGWAIDPNDPIKSIVVQFYLDGYPSQGGIYIGAVLADQSSFDVESVTGYTGSHRYAYVLPEATYDKSKIIRDGKAHTLFALAIDSQDPATGNTILTGSGLTFSATIEPTPAPATPTPILSTPSPNNAQPTAISSPRIQQQPQVIKQRCRKIFIVFTVCR